MCRHATAPSYLCSVDDALYIFIVCSLQEFAGEDNSDLFIEEKESAIKLAQEEKRNLQMSVPGILGPHEWPEEMLDESSPTLIMTKLPKDL